MVSRRIKLTLLIFATIVAGLAEGYFLYPTGLDWLLPALFLTTVLIVPIAAGVAERMTCNDCRGEKTRKADQLVGCECGHVICETCLLPSRKREDLYSIWQIFCAARSVS